MSPGRLSLILALYLAAACAIGYVAQADSLFVTAVEIQPVGCPGTYCVGPGYDHSTLESAITAAPSGSTIHVSGTGSPYVAESGNFIYLNGESYTFQSIPGEGDVLWETSGNSAGWPSRHSIMKSPILGDGLAAQTNEIAFIGSADARWVFDGGNTYEAGNDIYFIRMERAGDITLTHFVLHDDSGSGGGNGLFAANAAGNIVLTDGEFRGWNASKPGYTHQIYASNNADVRQGTFRATRVHFKPTRADGYQSKVRLTDVQYIDCTFDAGPMTANIEAPAGGDLVISGTTIRADSRAGGRSPAFNQAVRYAAESGYVDANSHTITVTDSIIENTHTSAEGTALKDEADVAKAVSLRGSSFTRWATHQNSTSGTLWNAVSKLGAREWGTLPSNGWDASLINVPDAGGTIRGLLEYAGKGIWDSVYREARYHGSCHNAGADGWKHIAYEEQTNTWVEKAKDPRGVHGYDHVTGNSDGQWQRPPGTTEVNSYTRATDSWAPYTSDGLGGQGDNAGIAVVYNEANKYLYIVGDSKSDPWMDFWRLNTDPKGAWNYFHQGPECGTGYHFMSGYNPIRQSVYIGGGTSCPTTWEVDSAHNVTTKDNAPANLDNALTAYAVDPVSGRWLVMWDAGFYEFDPAASPGSQWGLITTDTGRPANFNMSNNQSSGTMGFPLPDHDAILWVRGDRNLGIYETWVYRHAAP